MRSLVLLFLPLIQAVNVENDDAVANVDVFEHKVFQPKLYRVPFGHIFKEGIEDPFSDVKAPIDVLELHLKTPRSRAEAIEMLRDTPPERILRINRKKNDWYNEDDDITLPPIKPPKKEPPMWIDFAGIQETNLMNRPMPAVKTQYVKRNFTRTMGEKIPRGSGFPTPVPMVKWTNCTEFAKKSSSFHPRDLIDIEWTPFYVWSLRLFPVTEVHKFTYPTRRVVNEYRQTYGHYLDEKVDWNQPKLAMTGTFQALLIADTKDRRGLFHAVLKRTISNDKNVLKNMDFSVPKLRLKIVESYLAMVFCDEFYATIMASPDNLPVTDHEKKEQSKVLNFTGIGYPVIRDIQAEVEAKRQMLLKEKDLEDMKYIRAVGAENLKLEKWDYLK